MSPYYSSEATYRYIALDQLMKGKTRLILASKYRNIKCCHKSAFDKVEVGSAGKNTTKQGARFKGYTKKNSMKVYSFFLVSLLCNIK